MQTYRELDDINNNYFQINFYFQGTYPLVLLRQKRKEGENKLYNNEVIQQDKLNSFHLISSVQGVM